MPNLMASFLAVLGGRWSHPGADSLSQHLDGSLSPRRQGQVARHLDGCERCRAELESLRLMVGLLQRVPQVEPGRSFVFAAPPLVEGLPRAQGAPNWGLAAAGASLALLLAVLVSADIAGVLEGDGAGGFQGSEAATAMSDAPEAAAAAPEMEVSSLSAPAPAPAPAAAPAPVAAAAAAPTVPAVQAYTGVPAEPREIIVETGDAQGDSPESPPVVVLVEVQGAVAEDGTDLLKLDDAKAEAEGSPEEQGDIDITEEAGVALAAATAPPPAASTPFITTEPVPPTPVALPSTGTPAPAIPPSTGTPTPPTTPAPPATPEPTPMATPAPTPMATPAPTPMATPARVRTSVPTPTPSTPVPTPEPALPETPVPSPTVDPLPPPSKPVSTPSPRPTPEVTPLETVMSQIQAEDELDEKEPGVSDAVLTATPVEATPRGPQAVPQLVAEEVDRAEGGATSLWWRVIEGLLAALAVLALGLFFRRWRRRAI